MSQDKPLQLFSTLTGLDKEAFFKIKANLGESTNRGTVRALIRMTPEYQKLINNRENGNEKK